MNEPSEKLSPWPPGTERAVKLASVGGIVHGSSMIVFVAMIASWLTIGYGFGFGFGCVPSAIYIVMVGIAIGVFGCVSGARKQIRGAMTGLVSLASFVSAIALIYVVSAIRVSIKFKDQAATDWMFIVMVAFVVVFLLSGVFTAWFGIRALRKWPAQRGHAWEK